MMGKKSMKKLNDMVEDDCGFEDASEYIPAIGVDYDTVEEFAERFPRKFTEMFPENTTNDEMLNLLKKIDTQTGKKSQKEYDTPERVQQEIDNTLAILKRDSLIRHEKNEYRQTEVSTMAKIIATLEIQIKLKNITIPIMNEDSFCDFILTHIKDKSGNSILKETVKMAFSRMHKI